MAQRIDAEPTGQYRGVRTVLLALAVLLLALPATADAKSFRGKTSQKRLASVVVGDDNLVTRIRISYSAPCRDSRYRFPNVLRLEPPFDESSEYMLTQRVVLRDRLRGGVRLRQYVKVTAQRLVAEDGSESWSGTFKTRAVMTKRGKHVDTCELKRVTWTAEALDAPDSTEIAG